MSRDKKLIHRFLHVADLHNARKTAGTINPWWEKVIQKCATEHCIDAVICSGDIGEGGKKKDIQEGFKYLIGVCEIINKQCCKYPTLILTPGNHDVSRLSDDISKDDDCEEYRFKEFIDEVDKIKTKIECVMPKLGTNEYKSYFSLKESGIVIVPISTTWMSGEVPQEISEKHKKMIDEVCGDSKKNINNAFEAIKKEADINNLNAIKELLINNVYQAVNDSRDRFKIDIPYVREEDITELQEEFMNFSSDISNAKLRLAVMHHPLWSIPQIETAYRGFRAVSNGMAVLSDLENMGFQMIMHGHNHYYGCGIISGMKFRHGNEIDDIQECLSVSPGQFYAPDEDTFGFQILDVYVDEAKILDVSVTQFTKNRKQGFHLCSANVYPIPRKIREVDTYSARWSQIAPISSTKQAGISDYDKSLRYETFKNLGMLDFVWSVDTLPQRKEVLTDGDLFIKAAIKSNHEFIRYGKRGVDEDFIKNIISRSKGKENKCMIFVDINGGGTWGLPNLIEHASTLFRIYVERNYSMINILDNSEQIFSRDRVWLNTYKPLRDALNRLYPVSCISKCNAFLHFDLARILVWSKDALYSPASSMLIYMHKAFGVPLFFVDIKGSDQVLSTVEDFHLEWGDNNENQEDDDLAGWVLKGQKRVAIQKNMLKNYENIVLNLLNISEDPYEIVNSQFSWIMNNTLL